MKKWIAKLLASWAIKKVLTRSEKKGTEKEEPEEKQRLFTFQEPDKHKFWDTFTWFLDHGFHLRAMTGGSYFSPMTPFPEDGYLSSYITLESKFEVPVRISWESQTHAMQVVPEAVWTASIPLDKKDIKSFAKLNDMTETETEIFTSILRDDTCKASLSAKLEDPEKDIVLFLENFVRFLDTFLRQKGELARKQEDYTNLKNAVTTPKDPEA